MGGGERARARRRIWLFALFGGGVEAMGAPHGGLVHAVATTSGLVIGSALFAVIRWKLLAPHLGGSARMASAAAIGLVVGFFVGLGIIGPGFDFVLSVAMIGIIGGAYQWRILRGQLARPGRLFGAVIGAWVTAAIALLAVAILAGDAIDAAFGSGITGFIAITLVLGLVAGVVGGALEGAALRRWIGHPA